MTAKFEDLPESVQAQLREEMLHEEPAPETRAYVEERVAVLRAEAAAQLKAEPVDWDAEREADEQLEAALQSIVDHNESIAAEQAQGRFDKAQAEAAGVPLDFAQLYSKIEDEIDAFAERKQSKEVLAAVTLQLVTGYCAAAAERKQAELKHRYESALTGLRHLMVKENYGQLLVDDEDVARISQARPSLTVERLVSQKRTRYIIEGAGE
ncbi:hypothetical protein SEA_KING2_42 [Arthrobacter phage King2]|uniref:Uncharacterized protein n=1 Tax=Arthrobacter phage King2 TaxID=2762386 RepID=A0A7G8LQU0_9CAUD|nr:hypothetical protein SEA_KING2_42 [Arthrobacter phage King2]